METLTQRLYEALFLVDSGDAASDWDGIVGHIRRTLEKHGCEILSIRKWDERPLAYVIRGRNRGTYILSYFKADTSCVNEIERDFNLSERIIRVLITRGDHLTQADIEKETPVMLAERQQGGSDTAQTAQTAQAVIEKMVSEDIQQSQQE